MKRSIGNRVLTILLSLAVMLSLTIGDFASLYSYAEEEGTVTEEPAVNEATPTEALEEPQTEEPECEHEWGAWTSGKRVCTKCELEEVCTHQWEKTGEVKATCRKAGNRTYKCVICESTKTETIARLSRGAIKEKEKNGKYYWHYYVNGKRVTGTKWIKEGGVKAYYMKSGRLKTGWQKIKIKVSKKKKKKCKFYFGASSDGTPRMARGYTIISGKAYYFTASKTSLKSGVAAGKGAIKNSAGSMIYYCTGNGKLKTGYIGIGGKVYYFWPSTTSEHKMATRAYNYTNSKYPNIVIGSSGYMGGTKGKVYSYGVNALNKYGWSLKGAYKYSYKLKYANRPYRPKTVAQGATYGFTKKKGNCYVMNCCFHVMADMLGYEVRQIKGSCASYHAPHSWLEINHGTPEKEDWWVYDANFRNETKRNGFKIQYGQKGTWRYNRINNYLAKGF